MILMLFYFMVSSAPADWRIREIGALCDGTYVPRSSPHARNLPHPRRQHGGGWHAVVWSEAEITLWSHCQYEQEDTNHMVSYLFALPGKSLGIGWLLVFFGDCLACILELTRRHNKVHKVVWSININIICFESDFHVLSCFIIYASAFNSLHFHFSASLLRIGYVESVLKECTMVTILYGLGMLKTFFVRWWMLLCRLMMHLPYLWIHHK